MNERMELCNLSGNLSASALYYGRNEARLIPCERVTKNLVRQLVETCGCCVSGITPGQVLPEMAQGKLEFNFCRRPFPRA